VGEKEKMTPEQHIIYLYSALFLVMGITGILYFWLKDIINFKVKSTFIKGGVGRLYFDKVGNIFPKYQLRQKDGTLKIGGEGYIIDASVRIYRFLGVPTCAFVEGIPKNIDILKGEEAYIGMRTDDIDTHTKNITEGMYNDWFKQNGKWVIIGLFLLTAAIAVDAYMGYKVYSFVQDKGAMVIENVLKPQ
jgi:hypothetical protein